MEGVGRGNLVKVTAAKTIGAPGLIDGRFQKMLVQDPMKAAIGFDLLMVDRDHHLARQEFRLLAHFQQPNTAGTLLALPIMFRQTAEQTIVEDANLAISLFELFPGHLTKGRRRNGVALTIAHSCRRMGRSGRRWNVQFFFHSTLLFTVAGFEQAVRLRIPLIRRDPRRGPESSGSSRLAAIRRCTLRDRGSSTGSL